MNASRGSVANARRARYAEPARLWAVIAATVFVGEVIVMLVFAVLPPLSTVTEALLDGFMITAITTPPLLLFLFRPMVRQIEQRKLAERQLHLLNEQLEDLVAERTRDLTAANEQLRREIADRMTAESGLSKSSNFIQHVLEAAPCLLTIYDVNTLQCSFVNHRVDEFLGYSPDEAIVKGPNFFAEIFTGGEFDRFRDINMRMAAGIEDQIVTCECRLKDINQELHTFGMGLVTLAHSANKEAKEILLAAVPTGESWRNIPTEEGTGER